MAAIVDDGTERSKSDTSRDKEHIVTRELGVDRERSSVRTADRYLLSDFHGMKPLGDASALFNREFHKLGIRR